ncbi:MAG: magnesium transporter, partial [Planctomycetota bacterium]
MDGADLDRDAREQPTEDELRAAWPLLTPEDRFAGFRLLPTRTEREDFFFTLSPGDQADLISRMVPERRRAWLRLLDPDDITDVLQETEDPAERTSLLELLAAGSGNEVTALLAFAEDDAGGLMSPRFARVRPDMTCDEAISYLRRQAKQNLETIYYAYVLDSEQHLLGVVSLRELFAADPALAVSEVMETDVEAVDDEMDQEDVSLLMAEQDLLAIPVIDDDRRMQGIVTFDDVHDVIEEEATEDIQRMGGTAALENPYLETSQLE